MANKPGHRGEREAAVKTIAQGRPGDPGEPVVTNARAFHTTRAAAGATGTRLSLLPSWGGPVAELVGIEGGVVSGVINLESSGVEASDWRPRHDEQYYEA